MSARDTREACAKACEAPLTYGDIWNGIETTDDGTRRGPRATPGEVRAARQILKYRAAAIRARGEAKGGAS